MLGKVLVTEKDGSVISLSVSSRNTAGIVFISPSTPRCGREISSHARRLRACLAAGSCFLRQSAKFFSAPYHRSEPS